MPSGIFVTFLIVLAAVVVAIWVLPPTGKLALASQ